MYINGNLLQASGHERATESNRRMAPQENSDNLLKTVEDGHRNHSYSIIIIK